MITRKFIILFFALSALLPAIINAQPEDMAEITAINVNSQDGTTEIEIKSSAPFTYTIYRLADPYKLQIELQNTTPGRFAERLVFDRSGVLDIMPINADSAGVNAKLEISLTIPADIEPIYSGNSLILAFDNPDTAMSDPMNGESDANPSDIEYLFEDAYETEDVVNISPLAEKKYVGESISIDFQDAELIHVFRLISDISGYNIIVSPDVKGKFSMKLIDVPWDQALDVILRNYGLSKSLEGNILRIAPTSVLAKEEDEIARAKESQEKAGNLITRIYPINYADVEEIKKSIDDAKILTKRGFISVDARTSSVIIKDVEKKHAEYESLINALDVATPQVSIDAKIVEVRDEVQKELGIQWGMLWKPSGSRFTAGGVSTLAGGSAGQGFNSANPLMINLPALVGPGKGGNMGLGYIDASGRLTLDMQLSALESTGKAKVISNPKITTSDNEEAKIMQGEKIPYQTVSQEGTQTEFMDAFLELTVTPHITPEGTVVMKIEAKKNEADFTRQVLGVPTIAIKEVKTQVLVNDNDTLVIGGIFTADTTKNLESVPGFSQMPILGRFFQKKIDLNKRNELLIFITPRIVDQVRR
ncbi:MAG: type IV pilus secretin PilQ [Nitrospira sp.]|nr:type IV pilus secretin PilQ [Nitrospira sp.]